MSAGDPLRVFQARLAQLAESGLASALSRGLAGAALDAESHAKQLATERLNTRTGALRRSIRAEVRGTTLAIQAGEIGGQPLTYAAAQLLDRTTVIRPKRGRFLTQPVGPALTPAGVARFGSARDVPGLTFVISKAGKPLLIDEPGTVWYILHRSVTIRGTRVLNDALAQARRQLPLNLGEAIKAELLGALA